MTTLTFVGTASCVPPAGNDTACCLLNGHLLVDVGWCAALSMLRCGCDANALDHVIITRCHHDHYLGLASLLFYRSVQRARWFIAHKAHLLSEARAILLATSWPEPGMTVLLEGSERHGHDHP